jgi:hypothetical protein
MSSQGTIHRTSHRTALSMGNGVGNRDTALWGVLPFAGAVGWQTAAAAGMVEGRRENDYSPLPLIKTYQKKAKTTSPLTTVSHTGSRRVTLSSLKMLT